MRKILKRYPAVGAMIILCFFSAFIALCNGLLTMSQTSSLIQLKNQYAYQNEISVTLRSSHAITPEQLNQIVSNVDECNVTIENMRIYFEEVDGLYCPDVILCQNEPLSLPTTNKVSKIPDGQIIAASSTVGGNKVLNCKGKSFALYDIMDAEQYDFIRSLFIINASDYFEIFPDELAENNEVTLKVSSNKYNVYDTYAKIKSNTTTYIPDAIIRSTELESKEDVFQNTLSQETLVSTGLYLFAILNSTLISYYWIVVRKREIAIRKAFGATNFSVASLMIRELMILIGFSAILASAVQILIWASQGNILSAHNYLHVAIMLLGAIILAVMIAVIVPIKYILSIQPSEGVKL